MIGGPFGYAGFSDARSADMPDVRPQAYSAEQADRALRRAAERERDTVRITEGQRRALASRDADAGRRKAS